MAANQTVATYGDTYFPPDVRGTAELHKVTYGLSFPIGKQKLKGGFFKRESGKNLIKDAVHQLLKTERGERVLLPRFGCNLRKYLFQPLDEATFEGIKREIVVSFNRYIVGARLKKLKVVPYGDLGPAGGNSLLVTLTIELREADLTVFDVEVVIK